jgi:hypothetical protein
MRWAGTIANFFLPGLGNVIAGPTPLWRGLGVAMAVAMAILTWVELSIQTAAPPYYWPMFGAVLLFNTAFAVGTWSMLEPKS